MTNLFNPGTCNTCHKVTDVAVLCSSLGAISWAYCSECGRLNAEPEIMFLNLAFTAPFPPKLEHYSEWVRQCMTFVNGEYISFEQWLLLPATTPKIKQLVDEYEEYENGLVEPSEYADVDPTSVH